MDGNVSRAAPRRAVLRKIISGGQTGVDQAALRAARRLGLETGGWAPLGWKTQAGEARELLTGFGLVQYGNGSYKDRTYANVRDSDATIRLARNINSRGEMCTKNAIDRYRRPHLDLVLRSADFDVDHEVRLRRFLCDNQILILNVAGNSEETAPGIGGVAEEFLVRALSGVL